MNSAGDQPPPAQCPHCGHTNEFAGPVPVGNARAVCSGCGREFIPAALGTAPPSPFDDLFDEEGAPQWKETLSIGSLDTPAGGEGLAAETPLEFPDEADPLALEPAPELQPLEGEEPEKFDFADMAAAERQAETSQSESLAATTSGPNSDNTGDNDSSAQADVLSIDWPEGEQEGELTLQAPVAETLSPVFSTGIPEADDTDQPLRIEGLEDAGPAESMTTVRCRICDTLIYVQREQLGQKVKCPECYSEVLAQEATPHRKFPGGFKQEPAEQVVLSMESNRQPQTSEAEDEYRLSEPIERPKVEIPSHYGLESGDADLLSPQGPSQAPSQGPSQVAAQQPLEQKEAKSDRTGESKPAKAPRSAPANPERSGRWKAETSAGAGQSELPRPSGAKSGKSKSSTPPTPQSLPPYWQQRPVEPEAPSADDTAGMSELGLDDLLTPGGGLRRWIGQLVQDARLWVAFGLATLGMGLGYWALELVGSWLGDTEKLSLGAVVGSVFIGLPGLACFLFGAGLAAVTSALMFQLGARKQPRLSAWVGSSFADWGPAVGFVAFAFWLAVLPGAILGMLFAVLSGWPILVALFSSLSAVLLGPLLLASVCRSDSPFRVFDSKVLRQIQFERIDWLKFLPGSLLSLGLFLLGTLLLLIPGFIGSFFGAAGQVAGWVIFGSLTGLYCGLLVEKVNEEETK